LVRYVFIISLEKKIFSGELSSRENKDDEVTDYEFFKSNILIQRIYDDSELFHRCWDAYKLMQTNKPDRSSNGVDTWFKFEEDVNTITIMARTIVKANIIKVLSILAEVDLMSKFVDKFEEIKKLEEFSFFRWLVRIRIKMPMTFSNREIVAVGFGTCLPDTKACILPFRSLINNYFRIEGPEEDPNYKRIDMNFGFFHIKYIDENTCELANCYNVDPKIPVIPWFLLNTFIKELSYYIMNEIRQQIETADDKIYADRRDSNKEFYDHVWKTISKGVIEKEEK
jgi:hypothetical protein